MMKGISVKTTIGIGDAVQFSSVPENYYRATGKKLVEFSGNWIFEHNPFVIKEPGLSRNEILHKYAMREQDVVEMWNHVTYPKPRETVFVSLMEKNCAFFNVPCVYKFPRLYIYEDFPIQKREKILFQTHGVSHGALPEKIIEHVLKKYKGMNLFHIGKPEDPDIGIPKISTPTIWDLVREISECRMLIGPDSGPTWIAACYPDVIIKKVRTKPTLEQLRSWIPLEVKNIHSHWDCRFAQIFNTSEEDAGFTASYTRI